MEKKIIWIVISDVDPTLVVELGEGRVDLKLVQAGMVSIIVGHFVLTQGGALAADSVGNLGSFVLHRFVLADD